MVWMITQRRLVLKVNNLSAPNRGERNDVTRELGLNEICLCVGAKERVLIIGPRGSGKGALIDHIDPNNKNRKGITIPTDIDVLRVNKPEELNNKSLGVQTLILSEGHKFMEKQKPFAEIATKNQCTLLASMDRDQITCFDVFEPFTHLVLLAEGGVLLHCETEPKEQFCEDLKNVVEQNPTLNNGFPELVNLTKSI